ncbi:DUF3050 domain-containing protein [Thioalkalivibrio sulfidiphilus]|uniref:DUF3050 domain-containing protein n=1 Tax=Thioalkalivibrio sulfidiphilus TaxID=1033854 RepID=UPI00037C2164|nr:DUF3050 domain-containing protein [Thioalkalivibrio sulfidiphilus]
MSNPPPAFDPRIIAPLRERLDQHPVYGLRDLDDLRRFMECHIYSVWDFMSLIKFLQHHIAPARYPWAPGPDAAVCRFINELVLEEESDKIPGPDGEEICLSHFELYCGAMGELGADPSGPQAFVALAAREGIDAALASGIAPEPSRRFMESTFGFIRSGQPHVVAAALALGREHVIPGMFRSLLARMGITEQDAPMFHFYLKRHIHLDEDFHGPLSLRMLDMLCAGDAQRRREAEQAACAAIEARIRFWDDVAKRLEIS